MRYLGKSSLFLGTLAITLMVGAPLLLQQSHFQDHVRLAQMLEFSSSAGCLFEPVEAKGMTFTQKA
ncbi:MAG TPA: hypothetical protein VGS22_11405 [Thermoanaerobaculia bacterium]|jgi:hypothetical protein|nr:hypothetical protein [Thermoanaerobaculia bacterium]